MKAKKIMTKDVVFAKKSDTIRKFIKMLNDNKITGAPVLNDNDELVGIVSVKDILNALDGLLKVRLSAEEVNNLRGKFNWVDGIMTENVITVDPDTEVMDIFKLMVEKHIHRVPVTKNGKVIGIISASDAHNAIVEYVKEVKK
ncbi:MAG: CBS domain-containing protein [Elusimicrobia bacterium]|jgi:CBS domain-containing protein|nr:CBS domain-containing protein [Elusimicrobiota bacterium]